MSWNINGWHENTQSIRSNTIKDLDPDIAVIGETHLVDDELIQVEGYICINHNRKVGHFRCKEPMEVEVF